MNTLTAARSLLLVRGIPRLAPRTLAASPPTRPASTSSNLEDLGSPDGQMPPPPPSSGGGSDAIKRNGNVPEAKKSPLYAGIGLFALAAYAYLSQPREAGRAVAGAGERAKEAGGQELRGAKEEIAGGVQKMGGRDGAGGRGGFRSE